MDADHRQRAVLEYREDPVADRVEVLHEIALHRIGSIEERLVQVRQRHTVACLTCARRVHACQS